MKDFYYILGTRHNCSADAITEAYQKLSKKFGPESGEQDHFLQSHFSEITEAYETLSNSAKRTRYDALLQRHHRKQIANFKSNYTNIALTCALFVFTGLFGWYVIRSLNSGPRVVKAATVAQTAAVVPQKLKHHRRRHRAKPLIAVAKAPVIKKDTLKIVAVNPAPVNVLKPAPVITPKVLPAPVNKPALLVSAPTPALAKQPAVVKQTYAKADSSYTTNLKPDVAGLVYLHQLADYMSAVVTVLPHRSKIKVLQKGQTFYKVAFNDQVGYLPKWTLAKP